MTKLSIQLYSGRKFPPVEKQLETVEAAGFRFVEPYGGMYEDVGASQKLFEKHKVTAITGHVGIDMADGQRQRTLDMAKALGMKWVITPAIGGDARPTTRAGWAELGLRLLKLADFYQDHGIVYAWHNHDFEFKALADGSMPIDHILGGSLPWEADLAWVARGKADPLHWLQRFSGRVFALHVKDLAKPGERADEDGWADPGHGELPWAAYWKAGKAAGAQVMVAEHDNPNDFARFAHNAMKAMRALEGA